MGEIDLGIPVHGTALETPDQHCTSVPRSYDLVMANFELWEDSPSNSLVNPVNSMLPSLAYPSTDQQVSLTDPTTNPTISSVVPPAHYQKSDQIVFPFRNFLAIVLSVDQHLKKDPSGLSTFHHSKPVSPAEDE
jgi:hypothetical protein